MSLKHITRGFRRFLDLGKMPQKINFEHTKLMLENEIADTGRRGVAPQTDTDREVVVSLTTYGRRLRTVHLAIASMMRQSRKADRIVLWLDSRLEGKPLPAPLRLLEKKGLEICFCRDVRSFTKLVPALERFPEAVIITVDDDQVYDFDLIDRLVCGWLEAPEAVHCARMKKIAVKDGRILPYKKWPIDMSLDPSPLNLALGVGGVLYPPHCFGPEVTDSELFMRLSPSADDLWFKAQELKYGREVRRVPTLSNNGEDYINLPYIAFNEGLAGTNVTGGANDTCMANLAGYFKPLTEQ
ncbi:MAG: hypothetical protein K2F86_01625 [Duncaniella sp.]|nr:hypothetical protein [Duncaniella sp.]